MAAPVRLREDFGGARLRALAKRGRDAGQLRRLLAVAEIYDRRSRGEAARIGGVGLQTARDWALRFNARGPDGLKNLAYNIRRLVQLERLAAAAPT